MPNGYSHAETIPAKEAARIIGVAPKTLCEWRLKGRGPAFIRRVGRIFYSRSDIADWQSRSRVEF
jgi:predicted site-specific integrase-resolvase